MSLTHMMEKEEKTRLLITGKQGEETVWAGCVQIATTLWITG